MGKIRFEYRITIAYLIIGGAWILFSDRVLYLFITSEELHRELQTYKGWFYVIITGILFFLFLKKHLTMLRNTQSELKIHKNNLQHLVHEKTLDLHKLNKELNEAVDELHSKNDLINTQNRELQGTLDNLREAQSQLVESEKMASLGTLTAGIAHEINNPLNYLMGSYLGLSAYFQDFGSKDEKRTKLLLKGMKEGIDRASGIVSGLNQFSRINSSFDEDCDIHEILDNCLVILQNKTKHRVTIQKEFRDEPLRVKGNSGKLHQVFINILNNAIQSIEDKGKVSISSTIQNGSIWIEIRDTGRGIPKENLPQITTPFFTTKPPGEGTGLGLSVSYSIIKEHKGILKIDSEINKGTTVKISLPASNHEQ